MVKGLINHLNWLIVIILSLRVRTSKEALLKFNIGGFCQVILRKQARNTQCQNNDTNFLQNPLSL